MKAKSLRTLKKAVALEEDERIVAGTDSRGRT